MAAEARRRTDISYSLDHAAALGLAAAQLHRAPHELIVFLQDELKERISDLRLGDLETLCEIARHGRLVLREGRRCHEGCCESHSNEQFHRSTSPKTMSSEPRMADTSASMWPLQRKSIAC